MIFTRHRTALSCRAKRMLRRQRALLDAERTCPLIRSKSSQYFSNARHATSGAHRKQLFRAASRERFGGIIQCDHIQCDHTQSAESLQSNQRDHSVRPISTKAIAGAFLVAKPTALHQLEGKLKLVIGNSINEI